MHNNDALALLLRSGADGTRADKQGRTPLYIAAWAGNEKQIALLLNPSEVARCVTLEFNQRKSRNKDGVGSLDGVQVVVMRHSVPENNLENEESTLSDCWCDGREHTCRNVMHQLPQYQQGWTALHAASARAHHHCVQLLLAATGVDAGAQDILYRTPLDVAGCAHYMGHKIDVDNLIQTVDLLLKAGGKFLNYYNETHLRDTPLHTAVELESEAAVEQMLKGGASATVWNSEGRTAMHVCVTKRNKELLQLLANHKCSNEDPYLATVNVKDLMGSTVLGTAVRAEWIQGVCIALDAGASTTEKERGETPIHIAAQLGNVDILQKILNVAEKSTIDYCNNVADTALMKAISHNHLDVLKILLKHGANIEVDNIYQANVFHLATKCGSKEMLKYLLSYDSNITKRLINRADCFGPPLYYAIENNNLEYAELLISEGAQVNAKCIEYHRKKLQPRYTTLLHIAAKMNRCEIAEMIIKEDLSTIYASSHELRWTPLHAACQKGNKEMIKLLLRKGADLSGGENVNGSNYFAKQRKFIPIELLMNNVSKPTEFLEEVFDSYITLHKDKRQEFKCQVNHRVLCPRKPGIKRKHMGVIKALINTGDRYDQHRLLLHPLVHSFFYPKWRSLLPFFYSLLVLHVCFVISLNVFTLSLFWYKDRQIEPVPSIYRCRVWIYIIYITAFLLTVQEFIVINVKSKSYLLCLETSVKWLSTTLAVVLPQVVSWDSKSNPEWVRVFGSATLFVTWVRMMFMISRLPYYGYYVLMYGKVATKVFKILLSFSSLIIGFSIIFMIQFHAHAPFEDPWSSLVMAMVMMTSEFGYNETINEKIVEKASASLLIMRLIFVLFLILVSIILMNLLVGVAVNDVNSLEVSGNINRLEKQAQFVIAFEDNGCYNFIKKILRRFRTGTYLVFLDHLVCNPKKPIFLVSLQPHTCKYSNCLPIHIKEAIFEKALSQKKQSDDKQGTMLYQTKLDEIHKVIVKKDGPEPPKSVGPDNALVRNEMHNVNVKNDSPEPTTSERLASLETAMHKILNEILKLRSELEQKNSTSSS